jgi:hypothetical protein
MSDSCNLILASSFLRVFARWCGGELPTLSCVNHSIESPCLKNKCVYVPNGFGARQSFIAACSEVLVNSETEFGFTCDPKEAQNFQAFCVGLSSLIYSNPRPPIDTACSFGYRPVSFIILRDGVCPILGLPFDDVLLSEINDPIVESAFFIDAYVNRIDPNLISVLVKDVAFRKYLNAFLGDTHGPAAASLLLFLLCSMNGLDVESYGVDVFNSLDSRSVKVAQQSSSFWLFGLIEKMLAPSRGVNPKIHEKWAPLVDSLYAEIESERKKKGLTGAPLEFMLRVQSGSSPHGADAGLIQNMLEDARSW